MIRKPLTALALAAGLVATGAAPAAAHECYVANRSDAGNAGAAHSANWQTLTLVDLYRSAHHFLGGEPLTEAQVQEAVRRATAAGIPASVTLFERFTLPRSKAELAALSSASTDGKGIDHFFVAYGDRLVQIFFAVRPA